MLNTISRILIGFVFLFSGFVKAVDPIGGAIKIAEYLELIGLHNTDTISLIFAILLSTLEFIIGFQLFFGLKAKSVALPALLFMSFFTVLTLYIAIEEPVTDCGCFGDALKLSNWQTFYKNIILLPFSYWIFYSRQNYSNKLSKSKQSIGAIAGLMFILGISFYSLNNLPLLDFRPYKIGKNIQEGMRIPEGAPAPEYETTFILEKDGERKEFDINNYPYEDSTWVFTESKTITISEGYQTPIQNFILENENGDDLTFEILENEKPVFLMIAPKIQTISTDHLSELKQIQQLCLSKDYPFYTLTASLSEDYHSFNTKHDTHFEYLNADETLLKTIIRGNPGLVVLYKGTILLKYNHTNLPDHTELQQPLSHALLSTKSTNDKTLVSFFIVILVSLITVLYRIK